MLRFQSQAVTSVKLNPCSKPIGQERHGCARRTFTLAPIVHHAERFKCLIYLHASSRDLTIKLTFYGDKDQIPVERSIFSNVDSMVSASRSVLGNTCTISRWRNPNHLRSEAIRCI